MNEMNRLREEIVRRTMNLIGCFFFIDSSSLSCTYQCI